MRRANQLMSAWKLKLKSWDLDTSEQLWLSGPRHGLLALGPPRRGPDQPFHHGLLCLPSGVREDPGKLETLGMEGSLPLILQVT